jgi:hypothetical protein
MDDSVDAAECCAVLIIRRYQIAAGHIARGLVII